MAVKPIPIARCPGEKPAKPTPKKVSLILKIENDTSKVATVTTTTGTSEAGGGTRHAVKYYPGGGGGEGVADPAPAPVHSSVQGVEVAARKIFVVVGKIFDSYPGPPDVAQLLHAAAAGDPADAAPL